MRAMRMIPLMAVLLLGAGRAEADPAVESVQQTLKDQGFYYGELTGMKNADTTAALRRYQIRNGLQVTGELNAETRKSLGVSGAPAPRATPVVPVTPRQPARDDSDLRDDDTVEEAEPDADESDFEPSPQYRGAELFDGTPYEQASPEEQREVIMGAQAFLERRGYYRDGVDGVFGSGTAFALRAYQSRFGLEASGVLDTETLAALRLLPEQRGPRMMAPRRRIYPRPAVIYAPDGEPIYVPR